MIINNAKKISFDNVNSLYKEILIIINKFSVITIIDLISLIPFHLMKE